VLDQGLCHPMAVEVCEIQPPSTHAGAAWLRRQRLDHNERCGDPKLLRRSILRAINRFQYEYPGTTYRTIIDTLRRHADEWEAEWRRKEAPA
jgi:hypothetical protein